MKQTISKNQFVREFEDYNRADNFSYDGLRALFDFIEELDESCGTESELDVIALCCEFTEYSSLKEFQDNYSLGDYPDMESIKNSTMVIPVNDDGFIIQQF